MEAEQAAPLENAEENPAVASEAAESRSKRSAQGEETSVKQNICKFGKKEVEAKVIDSSSLNSVFHVLYVV